MLNKCKKIVLLLIILSVIFTTLNYALYGVYDIGYSNVRKEVVNFSKNSQIGLNLNGKLCQINISHLCQKQVSAQLVNITVSNANKTYKNTTMSLEKSKNNYIGIEINNVTVRNTSDVYTHVITEFTPLIASPSSTTNITKTDPHDPYSKIKEKLRSGLPISIHVINLSSWLLPYLKNAPACSQSSCVFDQDNITANTDVVVIVGFHLTQSQRPAHRWPGQLYLLLDKEPPMNLPSYLWDGKLTDLFFFTTNRRPLQAVSLG